MFQIPENLDRFSPQGLRELATEASEAHATLLASVTPDTVTDEQLTELESLKTFVTAANEKLTADGNRTAKFADVTVIPAVVVNEPAPQVAASAAILSAQATAEDTAEHVEQAKQAGLSSLRISDINPEDVSTEPAQRQANYGTLIAAADVPGFAAGQRIDMAAFGRAFQARAASYSSMPRMEHEIMHGVAVIERDYPAELSVWMDERDEQVLANVRNETALPGGSLLKAAQIHYAELGAEENPNALLAASGWCAPSETIYSICSQVTTDGLLDVPEVQARRGGVRHNTGLDFSTIFGNGTGFFNLTEAQVAAGTVKTCKEIPCPDFVDDRLGVTGVCLTGNILAIRGYPEYTSTFTSGALAVSAHQVNAEQIAAIVTGSTAVSLTAVAPWSSDGTVVSQVLGAVEMAAVDIKYALRLQRSATLELLLPFWMLAQFRADFSRRTGGDHTQDVSLVDSQIISWFATRGVRVQWLYDWQDAFSDSVTAGEPGSATPITKLPTSLDFVIYPAGTWVRAVSDVITLNSVYDSTLLATNQVTHLFTETGWKMLKMCPLSRVYTIGICPSGETTSTQSVTCS